MRKGLLFIGILTACGAAAQVSPYYQSALGLGDDSLKAELHNIIDGHTTYPYSSSSTDVWDMLKETDKDTNNADNVILLYSGRSVDGDQEYNNGAGWNREHVWAKSRGNFGNSQGPGTDAHHLRPCDISVNSTRNNRNFDDCVSCVDVIDEGQNTGSRYDNGVWTFEPRDAVKGDVARMIFYMAVRYEGDGSEPDLELTDALQAQGSQQPLHAVLSTLLEWHRSDTVDAFEANRNEVIFGFQGNRNPFIDYPELAEHLWGLLQGAAWTGPSTIGLEDTKAVELKVYPNPTSRQIQWDEKVEKAELFDLQGRLVASNRKAEGISLESTSVGTGTYLLVLHRVAGTPSLHRIYFQP